MNINIKSKDPDHSKSKEIDHVADDTNIEKINAIKTDEMESKNEPEPIENLLEELKKKEKNANNDKKITTLLTDLNKTMTQSSDHLIKVFVNKAWRIFDIGKMGSSRRTRNVQEVNILLASFYAILGLLNQIIYGMHLGNNNAQKGSIFDFLNPLTYFGNTSYGYPVDQKAVGAIAGLPARQKKNSSDLDINYIIVIDDENKEKVNRLLNGKTSKDILLKIKEYLDKDELNTREKFYIVWKLYNLFAGLFNSNDETILKLITIIIDIGEDPRFQRLFDIFKAKKDPKFEDMWKLFKKSKPKLHKKYLTTVKNFPGEKIKDLPSQNCFMISPDQEIKSEKPKKDNDDDELFTRSLESNDKYYIFCNDDDNESEANRLLEGESDDDVILKIKKYLDKDDLDPEHAWYIVLKLYKMFKNLSKDDKDSSKVIQLVILIGKDPKFEILFKNFKSKKDPRLQDIWILFKSDPEDLEKLIKSLPKKEISKDPLSKNQPKDEKITKDEKEPKKNTEIMKNKPIETSPSKTQTSSSDFTKIPYYTGKTEILYSDLEEVEILLKDPSLNSLTRRDIINFVHKWSHGLGNQPITDEKIKRKIDELVLIIKENKEFNSFFETLSSPSVQNQSQHIEEIIKTSPISSIQSLQIQIDPKSGAVLEAVIKHIKETLQDPTTKSPSRESMVHLAVALHKLDHLNETTKHKLDEIIDTIKRNPENNRIYESLRTKS